MSDMLTRKEYHIICVGNRYVPADSAGPRVYDVLTSLPLPDNTLVIDGGLLGLNLLKFVEGAREVIFVDTLKGFGPPEGLIIINDPLSNMDCSPVYGHGEGLLYMLRMLPALFPSTIPRVTLLGAEGYANDKTIHAIASHCLAIINNAVP